MQSFGSFLFCANGKQTAESGILFFLGLFYKSAKISFYCECTQIKANLLQFRLSLWLKGVFASTVRRGKKSSDCSSAACAQPRTQLSFATLTIMQPVHYHYKKQSVKHGKKNHTAQFKYVVKSVPLSIITVPPWSYAKHFVLHGYWNASEAGLHKRWIIFWH